MPTNFGCTKLSTCLSHPFAPSPLPSILELERLNAECESTLSRECSLEAVEARNILKVALGAQAAAVGETNRKVAARLFEKEHKQE
jgi:hypothetical protein